MQKNSKKKNPFSVRLLFMYFQSENHSEVTAGYTQGHET